MTIPVQIQMMILTIIMTAFIMIVSFHLYAEGGGIKSGKTSQSIKNRTVLYVNNKTGNDMNNGLSSETALATIAKAISLSKTSGKIILTSSGIPYNESMIFNNLGGTPEHPFEIDGNGAVLSGMKPAPLGGWEKLDNGICRYLSNKAYGAPFLYDGRKMFKRYWKLEKLPEGAFCCKNGYVYFRLPAGKTLADYELRITALSSGLALVSSSYITCRNLICEHFANDGFNFHGTCRGIVLEHIKARYCSDDGISMHDEGDLKVNYAHIHDCAGFGIADINNTKTSYNNVLVEQKNAVRFSGSEHQMINSVVKSSGILIIAGCIKKSQYKTPTKLFLKNSLFYGKEKKPRFPVLALSFEEGKFNFGKSDTIIEHCIILDRARGVKVGSEANLVMKNCIVADCKTALDIQGTYRGDYNFFGESSDFIFRDKTFSSALFKNFTSAAGTDIHSIQGQISIIKDVDGGVTVKENSNIQNIEHKKESTKREDNKFGPIVIPRFPKLTRFNQ